jgi:hypothetical protein
LPKATLRGKNVLHASSRVDQADETVEIGDAGEVWGVAGDEQLHGLLAIDLLDCL